MYLVDGRGGGPLVLWEPEAGDDRRGGHHGHAGDPVENGADVTGRKKHGRAGQQGSAASLGRHQCVEWGNLQPKPRV